MGWQHKGGGSFNVFEKEPDESIWPAIGGFIVLAIIGLIMLRACAG